jgi:tRNA (cytidine/uridine-2'-O-)-methyltransferase
VWQSGSVRVVLYQPEIPQNAGSVLRTAACLGVAVAIIEPAGFPVSDSRFRRAGMDYLDAVALERHVSWGAFETWLQRARAERGCRLILATTRAALAYTSFGFAANDVLLFGRESAGVPQEVHGAADARILIPMRAGMRSLNVAVAAGMILGEALRQTRGFPALRRESDGE